MAVDCQKHLSYEPVSAGPPSTAYRVSRFARRHRFGVAVAASLLVLVVAFAASMAILAGKVSREAARANEAE